MYLFYLYTMLDFSFLSVPNIEGMRLWWYIQLFGIVVLFGVSLFFVFYFWFVYHKKQQVLHQLDAFGAQARELQQQLLQHKIEKAKGKTKLILFIEYLERFVTSESPAKSVRTYANVSELLIFQGFTPQEVQDFEHVLYADWLLPRVLEKKITQYMLIAFTPKVVVK